MSNKQKISISVGDEVLDKIDESVKSGVFRNRSHAFEFGLKKIISEGNDRIVGREEDDI